MKFEMSHDRFSCVFWKCPLMATGYRFRSSQVLSENNGMTLYCRIFQFQEVWHAAWRGFTKKKLSLPFFRCPGTGYRLTLLDLTTSIDWPWSENSPFFFKLYIKGLSIDTICFSLKKSSFFSNDSIDAIVKPSVFHCLQGHLRPTQRTIRRKRLSVGLLFAAAEMQSFRGWALRLPVSASWISALFAEIKEWSSKQLEI